MRVLLDEQLPRQLAYEFSGHDVRTVQQQAWSGLGNGELLRRAADDSFEVFVTADRNLEFQENLARSSQRRQADFPSSQSRFIAAGAECKRSV